MNATEGLRKVTRSGRTALSALVLLIGLPVLAHAGLYKCIDEKTKSVTYSGTPCVSGAETAIMDGKTTQREVAGHPEEARQAPSASTGPTAAPNNSAERKRLAAECAAGYRGYQNACNALRAINGELRSAPHSD